MKKLNKLVISPEKIMKNEELINLQGGYGGSCDAHAPESECNGTCWAGVHQVTCNMGRSTGFLLCECQITTGG